MSSSDLLRKGRVGITVFESTSVKSTVYKAVGKERLIRVLKDSSVAAVVTQVLAGVSQQSAIICELHFLDLDEDKKTYTVSDEMEETECTSLVALVHKYVMGQAGFDVREYESADKVQKGATEVLTLHLAAFQPKGAGTKKRFSVSSTEGGSINSGNRRAKDPDYEAISLLFNSEALRVPHDISVDFSVVLQKILLLQEHGSGTEVNTYFTNHCPRLVPHTKAMSIRLPNTGGCPGGPSCTFTGGGPACVKAFAARREKVFIERATEATGRSQQDCRAVVSKYCNSVKSNNVRGFQIASPAAMQAQAAELLADITVERELKIDDAAVDALVKRGHLTKRQGEEIKALEVEVEMQTSLDDADTDGANEKNAADVVATRQATQVGAAALHPVVTTPPTSQSPREDPVLGEEVQPAEPTDQVPAKRKKDDAVRAPKAKGKERVPSRNTRRRTAK